MSVYDLVLIAHSYVRWALVVAALLVLIRASIGWRMDRAWTDVDAGTHQMLVGIADLQFTLGVLLYAWLSPFAFVFMHEPALAMKEHTLRFFGLEHPTMMVLAVALLHVGHKRANRAALPRDKHRLATLWTLAAVVIVCSSIPWPGLRHGRPLLRGPSTTSTATH